MAYSKENLSQYLDKIFDAFNDCQIGEGGFFCRVWYNENTSRGYKRHLFDVLIVLIQNDYISPKDSSNLPFLKLTSKGFDYLQGASLNLEKMSFYELIGDGKIQQEVFDRLWEFIGKAKEAPFYLKGPDFFKTVSPYVGLSSYTYKGYMDLRKNDRNGSSRIDWYRELFLKIPEGELSMFLNELSNVVISIYQSLFIAAEEDCNELDFLNSPNIQSESSTSTLDFPVEQVKNVNMNNENILEDQVKKKIFISYTWELKEHPEHKAWVKSLADKLKEYGFDVRLDQYQPFGTNMDNFMVQSVHSADRIILVCTPIFKERSDNMIAAAGFEASLISNELIQDITSTKFLPLVRIGEPRESMPLYLGNRNALIWHVDDSEKDNFKRLVDDLMVNK